MHLLALLALGSGIARAQTENDFYKGKSIRFAVVYEPGGTYDIYSRLFSAYLPRHIPGQPPVVVQYLPGAGGLVGTLSLYERAPQDGTQLGMLPRDIAINQMLHPDEARYDARRFNWVGRISSYTGVMFVATRTGVKTGNDLKRISVAVGSWGPSTDSFVTPALLNALAGTKFKIVTGYRGAADVDLAIERNEVDARVSSWTAMKATRSAWLHEGKIVIPFQTGLNRHPDMPNLPLIGDLATDAQGRKILEFMNSDASIGWNVVAPPNVPAERVALLRRAFDETLRDPQLLDEAKRRGLEIVPAPGEAIQDFVTRTVSTAPEAVERVKSILANK